MTKQEFDKRMESQIAYYESYYGAGYFAKPENASALKSLKEQTLDSLADEMFAIQKATELKLVPADAELTAEVDKTLKEQITQAGSEAEFTKQITALKYTVDDFKASIKRQIIIGKLYDYVVKDVTATDDEINKYYQTNLYDYTTKPNTMNLSHILVKTQDEAIKIKKEYDAGKSFEELAKQYGTDGTKDKGGLLGDIAYNDTNYDKTFLQNALLVPEGKVSQPVQTQFGWHLIKCNKRTEYPAKPLSEVKEDVKTKVLDQKKSDKYDATMKEWKAKASIKVYKDRL
jgi:foldase protein PrsA